eukprot:TRINITY_DN12096_c0_g1_i1.p1 TRINITY_DN12096_c0_g1~~TRINITY_DN12096_c0_g1_i1.p1  ORF type:complete len:386 (-),score=57.63 TRINITY_DN12096_c0_g1_i1:92-1249(-)
MDWETFSRRVRKPAYVKEHLKSVVESGTISCLSDSPKINNKDYLVTIKDIPVLKQYFPIIVDNYPLHKINIGNFTNPLVLQGVLEAMSSFESESIKQLALTNYNDLLDIDIYLTHIRKILKNCPNINTYWTFNPPNLDDYKQFLEIIYESSVTILRCCDAFSDDEKCMYYIDYLIRMFQDDHRVNFQELGYYTSFNLHAGTTIADKIFDYLLPAIDKLEPNTFRLSAALDQSLTIKYLKLYNGLNPHYLQLVSNSVETLEYILSMMKQDSLYCPPFNILECNNATFGVVKELLKLNHSRITELKLRCDQELVNMLFPVLKKNSCLTSVDCVSVVLGKSLAKQFVDCLRECSNVEYVLFYIEDEFIDSDHVPTEEDTLNINFDFDW